MSRCRAITRDRGRPRVLFRLAAGPRLGYGHMVRAIRLARALGVRPRMSVRGGPGAKEVARRLGALVESGTCSALLRRTVPDVLVVDEPTCRLAAPWFRSARRRGVLSVGVHDLGLGCVEGDLVFDGSAGGPWRTHRAEGAFVGPAFAILDPGVTSRRWRRTDRDRPRVLVALGGGRRAALLIRVGRELCDVIPEARVRVASGLCHAGRVSLPGVTWLTSLPTLSLELSAADVAIVAGGVTAYEACALGVPTVAASVVKAQRPTIAALSSLGALLDAGALHGSTMRSSVARIAALTRRLINDPRRARSLSLAGRAITDGRGAERAAAIIRASLARRAAGTGARS